MTIDMTRFQDVFFEEAFEHLATMESGLLGLEERAADTELLHTIFRAAHSIKGGSGSFGFVEISRFTHALESVLDRLRGGGLEVEHGLTDLLLRSSDLLRELVEATRRGEAAAVDVEGVLADLKLVLGEGAEKPGPPAAATVCVPAASAEVRVRFAPHAGFFRQGQDVLLVLDDLRAAGEVLEAHCDLSGLPSLDALDPESCYLRWEYRLRAPGGEKAVRDAFLFVEDTCDLAIGAAEEPAASRAPAAPGGERRAAGDRRSGGDRRAAGDTASVRVPTEKVDQLVNLAGELVIAQSMLRQSASGLEGRDVSRLLEALTIVERGTRELQEKVMSIRMLPIGSVFQRFPRLVRDLSQTLGKHVRLDVSGADIELDKSVIEKLGDPLIHLLRNALDHGIETPAERAAAGKPEEGVITLRAFHQAGNVVIEIADDGRGLDFARIRDKAVAQGLIRPDAALGEPEAHELLFRPGFSTATTVSDVSGRGVGMDVVRRNVQALNGSIGVSSEAGRGSRFRVRLPLTLAILDGLTIGVGRETFILPMLSIAQTVRPAPGEVKTVLGGRGEVFTLRGQHVPLVRLSRVLGVAGAEDDPARGIIVILESEAGRFGVLADDVLGQSQVVIKSLERNYRKIDAVMGATILGDGRVTLILDVSELRRVAMRHGPEAGPSAHEPQPEAVGTGAGSSVLVR